MSTQLNHPKGLYNEDTHKYCHGAERSFRSPPFSCIFQRELGFSLLHASHNICNSEQILWRLLASQILNHAEDLLEDCFSDKYVFSSQGQIHRDHKVPPAEERIPLPGVGPSMPSMLNMSWVESVCSVRFNKISVKSSSVYAGLLCTFLCVLL